MSLKHTIKFILNHPLNRHQRGKAVMRFLRWQIRSRLNSYPSIYPYGEKSKIIVKQGLTGATGNLYAGLHEFADMSFLLHFLRPTDLFVDIGANIGSYTILGASERRAETISIEPIPQTFKILQENIVLNNVSEHVTCLNIGMGSKKGILKFTKYLDTVNHVASSNEKDTIDVHVDRFDELIDLNKTALVKMDVEGYETEVIKGMDKALSNTNFKALIIELNGSGRRYGYNENAIHEKLLTFNFLPYSYQPFYRTLTKLESYGKENTIYIKDYDFVAQRVHSATSFNIHGKSI